MTAIKTIFSITALLLLGACATPAPVNTRFADFYYNARAIQCVPYARNASGIQFHGDAWTWWKQARPENRGSIPARGAVLVLASTMQMPHGHLAVVTNIIDREQIDVTHSNWGSSRRERARIFTRQRIADVSKNRNWTLVRFWNPEKNSFGLPYTAKGFIYR